MNTARELSRAEYDALKDATHELVEGLHGPKAIVADKVTRTDASRLSRYGSRYEAMFAPIDVIADLESRLGRPIVTAILADLIGCVLVPKGDPRIQPDLSMTVGTVAKETGEATFECAKLITDQSPQQIARTRKELREAHEAISGAERQIDIIEKVTPILKGRAR